MYNWSINFFNIMIESVGLKVVTTMHFLTPAHLQFECDSTVIFL